MDSQLTLVDAPAGAPSAPGLAGRLILQLSADDVHNTTITVGGGALPLRYLVESDVRASSTRVTKLSSAGTPELVGIINRRGFFPDTIQLGEFTMDLGRWLKTPALSHLPATFTVSHGSFTWRQLGVDQLGLHSNAEEAKNPVAWTSRTPSPVHSASRQNAQLAPTIHLREEAEGIIDEIVLSFLALEHRLRAIQRAKEAKMAAAGGSASSVPMFVGH